jgi:hypothetical protein
MWITSKMWRGAMITATPITPPRTAFASVPGESSSKLEQAENSPRSAAITQISKPPAMSEIDSLTRGLRSLGSPRMEAVTTGTSNARHMDTSRRARPRWRRSRRVGAGASRASEARLQEMATADASRFHGRLPFRPRLSAGRAPPKIPKCSCTRLACAVGGRSLVLSQSRLNRSTACLPASVGRGRSRWSPSSGLTFFNHSGPSPCPDFPSAGGDFP